MQFSLHRAGLSPLVKRQNQYFHAMVNSDSGNEQGIVQEAENSVWDSSQYTEYMRSPCQQMATRHLFIKFGPLVDHGESISADKFLLSVHSKWIFLLGVHTNNPEDRINRHKRQTATLCMALLMHYPTSSSHQICEADGFSHFRDKDNRAREVK